MIKISFSLEIDYPLREVVRIILRLVKINK